MQNKARICYQIVIEGTLQLDSPLLIGSGQNMQSPESDIQVLKNEYDQPFIPGTSITGVLRHMIDGEDELAGRILFGHIEDKDTQDSLQSAIMISDVLLSNTTIIVRDGVCINPYTRVAQKGQKYNYEAIERSTEHDKVEGHLKIVVTLREYHVINFPDWKLWIQSIVNQLAYGIRIGALTSKGFGRVSVPDIKAYLYDLSDFADVKNWLLQKPSAHRYEGKKKDTQPIGTFTISGDFSLKTSLLVRSYELSQKEKENNIHAVPVLSDGDYLIPGTSVKGVLRHHAAQILLAIGKEAMLDSDFNDLMGFADQKNSQKSRFFTDEVYISAKAVTAKKQTRNAIDRFTCSTMDSRLFAEKPLWQKDKTIPSVTIRYTITDSKKWERGLALFLLKDLWTGRIALGGDQAVGRGYLQGIRATIRYFQSPNTVRQWIIEDNGHVIEGDTEELESFARALLQTERKEN